jgi:hypothetical protein
LINKESFERIIDLAEKVYMGRIDPLEIDIDRFIDMLKVVDVESLSQDLMFLDIRALYGLAIILEAQSEAIKRKTQGLYLDSIMIRIKLMNLDPIRLASLLDETYYPPIELSMLTEDDILEAKIHFNSIVRYRWTPPKQSELKVEPMKYFDEKEMSSMIMKLYEELVDYSGYKWVDYLDFISRGDMLLRAYLLSFLVSDGYVDMKINRVTGEISICPLKDKKIYKNPASLPVVLKGEEG